jgi:hypothetical protein
VNIQQIQMTDYLDRNLLPLIFSINPADNDSDIIQCLGGDDDIVSQQSLVIKFGIKMEDFGNIVISDVTKNLLEDNNYVIIDGKKRQVDHLFVTKGGVVCYCEAKCSFKFDSEKIKASNEKVKLLAETFGNIMPPIYFTPVRRVPRRSDILKFQKEGIMAGGMEWLSEQIDLPFSLDEYFNYLKDVCGPIMEEKGLILKNANK